MRLTYFSKKINSNFQKYWFIILIIFSVFGAYGLGFLSLLEKSEKSIFVDKYQKPVFNFNETRIENKNIVASKSGTKFYYIWCSGSNRIKEENKVFFSTIEEAQNEGYKSAQNCLGL
jgi:hypothetical protein